MQRIELALVHVSLTDRAMTAGFHGIITHVGNMCESRVCNSKNENVTMQTVPVQSTNHAHLLPYVMSCQA